MKRVFFIVLFLVFSISFAQTEGTLSGKILDAELYNEPLLMATVSIKNTSWKAQTNFNGNFEISGVAPGEYTLQISFLGYENAELPIVIEEQNTTYITESLKAKTISFLDVAESVSKEKE